MSLTEQERIERRRGYERKYYYNPVNRQKDYARGAANAALARGDIVKPLSCQDCGETTDLEAHHPDYSKPLQVQWLCVRCHRAVHHKTHCKHGHELTADNLYVRPNSSKRSCRACNLNRLRKFRARAPR